jgi:hypothetical protein
MRIFSIDRGFWRVAAVVFGSGAWASPALAQYTRVERFPIADELSGIPVKETLIISTIQGRVVNTRVRLNFQTVGGYDASLFAVGLFQGSRGVGVSGSSLGWFGPGSFTAEFDSPDLNGEIDFAGNPFATWFMVRSSGLPGGPGVVGVFSGSSFDVEYIPDCPADLDNDGSVGLGDVASIIGAWGDDSPRALQDLDVDGQVGLGDLAAVINAWGFECPCPNCR